MISLKCQRCDEIYLEIVGDNSQLELGVGYCQACFLEQMNDNELQRERVKQIGR